MWIIHNKHIILVVIHLREKLKQAPRTANERDGCSQHREVESSVRGGDIWVHHVQVRLEDASGRGAILAMTLKIWAW